MDVIVDGASIAEGRSWMGSGAGHPECFLVGRSSRGSWPAWTFAAKDLE